MGKENPINTETKIRRHLAAGKSLTSLQALNLYGTIRAAEFVRRLRVKGMRIKTTMLKSKSGKYYGKYQII